MDKRTQLIEAARSFIGVRFSHQGRSRRNGLDCGGLVLLAARQTHLSSLEFLGYADFPADGEFDRLLEESCLPLGWTSSYPHNFDGTEFLPGDLLSFDYKNGEGTRHIALVTDFKNNRYTVIDAHPQFGVSEHPLALEFAKAKITGWRIFGIDD